MADDPTGFPPVKTYKVFNVAEDYEVLPKGDPRLYSSLAGTRVVQIVDTNQSGVADSGDTAITNSGSRTENARFNAPLTGAPASLDKYDEVSDLWVRNHPLTKQEFIYNVQAVKRTGPLSAAIQLAGSMQNYVEGQAAGVKRVASGISDHPLVAAAITGIAGVASLHPAGRVLLEGLGMSGAVTGTGYIVKDRIEGIRDGKPMGAHDVEAGLAIYGGAASLGMTHQAFLGETANLLGKVVSKIGGKGGGFILGPQLAGSGAVGGIVAISRAEAAVSAAFATSPAGARAGQSLAVAASSVAPIVVRWPHGGARELVFPAGAKPQNIAWDGSHAARSASALRDELERTGNNAGLERFDEYVTALKAIYQRASDDEVRATIAKSLSDLEVDVITELERPSASPLRPFDLVEATAAKLKHVIEETNQITPDFVALEPVVEPLRVPFGVRIADGVERAASKEPTLAKALRDALDVLEKGRGDIQSEGGGLRVVRFHDGPGTRIYFGEVFGKKVVVRVGTKRGQEADIREAQRLLGQLKRTRKVSEAPIEISL